MDYLQGIKFRGYLISRLENNYILRIFNFAIWSIRNILRVFNFGILVKQEKKVTLNNNFFIVNQCNCYQICYRNSYFVTTSKICDMCVSISYFDQVLGNRKSQTRYVFNFAILWF